VRTFGRRAECCIWFVAPRRDVSGLEDPAEVVAVALGSLIQRAADEPEVGWLLVRLEISHDLAFATLGPHAARDLRRGIKSGGS
jgi:hypothetical protein